jgi:aminoglycoside phosphotransferase (APT) family kinase protein
MEAVSESADATRGELYPTPTAKTVAEALRQAGLDIALAQIVIEARGDRWLVRLPDYRLAWFPANARGVERLATERRVLRLLTARCSFRVPQIVFESAAGWDVRAAVPGTADPWGLYERIRGDAGLARRIGEMVGAMLAEQHTLIRASDVAAWLPAQPEWPEPTAQLRRDLSQVIDDRALLADIDGVLDAYDRISVAAADRVLVHGDLGLHNMAVDPVTGEVRGLFDYDGASWADRHHDFRYLLFDEAGDDLLEAALANYEPAAGRTLNRQRITLYNAACAIGFLAYRRGVAPEERSCGRMLAEDLRWVRGAMARL